MDFFLLRSILVNCAILVFFLWQLFDDPLLIFPEIAGHLLAYHARSAPIIAGKEAADVSSTVHQPD